MDGKNFPSFLYAKKEKIMVLLLFILWNLFTFLLMGIDKKRAKKKQYRISEKTLFLSAFFFGALGTTLGMNLFRHKTKHWYFKIGFPVLLIIQLLLILYYFIKLKKIGN